MSIDAKLKEMGLVLPKATDPVGSYVATKISGNLLYISGQISIDAEGQLIKDLGEHPEDKKPVRIMKGQYGPYIKYKSLNATIPEEKDPIELTMEEALILIEKRKEYDKNKKKKKGK